LGTSLANEGQASRGLAYLNEAKSAFRDLSEADKAGGLAQLDLAETDENVGNALVAAGQPLATVSHAQQALDLRGASLESDLELTAGIIEARADLAKAHAAAAQAPARSRGDQSQRDATRWANESLQLAHEVLAKNPDAQAVVATSVADAQAVLTRTGTQLAQGQAR
jgi:hypothetical protein